MVIQKVPHALLRPNALQTAHEMRFIAPFVNKVHLPRWVSEHASEDAAGRKKIKDKEVSACTSMMPSSLFYHILSLSTVC